MTGVSFVDCLTSRAGTVYQIRWELAPVILSCPMSRATNCERDSTGAVILNDRWEGRVLSEFFEESHAASNGEPLCYRLRRERSRALRVTCGRATVFSVMTNVNEEFRVKLGSEILRCAQDEMDEALASPLKSEQYLGILCY